MISHDDLDLFDRWIGQALEPSFYTTFDIFDTLIQLL